MCDLHTRQICLFSVVGRVSYKMICVYVAASFIMLAMICLCIKHRSVHDCDNYMFGFYFVT